jgi:trehalose/maltose hydrolase-like predicted phosphorylase
MDLLPPRRVEEIAEQIGLAPEEPERWRDISRRMTVPFHGEGIISQFDGYDRLLDADVAAMNMQLVNWRDGRAANEAFVAGSADALRTWRQP